MGNTVTLSLTLRSFASEAPPSWQPLFDQAKAADGAGLDRLVVSDHVVFGERLEEYARPEVGGQAGGRQPTGPDGHWLEPLTVLTAISSITDRVRLGTGILLAALRRPAVLAKQLSTLDVLSGGRLDIGVGVGWQREEYEAAGLDFESRGRQLDHTLEVCQTLWRNGRASYESPELHFEGIHQMPKPIQEGGVPLWVSGTANQAVFRRLAKFGSAWILWGPAAEDPVPAIAAMRRSLRRHGHPDPTRLGVSAPLYTVRNEAGEIDLHASVAPLASLVEAGVTDFRVAIKAPAGLDALTNTYGEWVDSFRQAVA
jgi:probable F420-dependent oxidoreductase